MGCCQSTRHEVIFFKINFIIKRSISPNSRIKDIDDKRVISYCYESTSKTEIKIIKDIELDGIDLISNIFFTKLIRRLSFLYFTQRKYKTYK